ncbi:hypothetical protein [Pantoea ananatis]|uniref:hypothetical protein n=1 Tax=Pantoea ananas TaxID=553 RepID=UPI001B311979|nr:hypothetical protein [Pantoea ananatis]
MMHSFTDLSESRLLNAYASQVIEAIQEDESAPHLFGDIRQMLINIDPDQMVSIGKPAITAPAKWWGEFFGLTLSKSDIEELKGIDL